MLISRLKSGLGMLWKSHPGSHVCVCVHKRAMGSLWASAPIGQDQAHLRGRIIKTLDPTKFSSSGQNYFSFSDRHALMVVVNTNDGRVQYIRIRYCYQENFPKGTRGFLYYHTPPPGDSAMSGSLRFRITNDSDPSDFSNGVDLRFPDGRPWQIFLHSMATQPAYALLVEKALADGLVTKEVVEKIKEHKRLPRTMFNLSNSLHEPFTVSVNARYKSLSFTVDDKIETEVVKLPFVEKRRHLREVMPYQGRLFFSLQAPPFAYQIDDFFFRRSSCPF